jgi:ribosomal protein S1
LFGSAETWSEIQNRFPIGAVVTGTVYSSAQFGVFVHIGNSDVGLLRITEMAGSHRKQLADYPQIGETVTAKVIWHDDRNRQVILNQRY